MMKTIERLESQVRGYVRSFPTVFAKAEGAVLTDTEGRQFLDFFAGAGALNYGHNPEPLREALLRYITSGAPTHTLDMATVAKVELLEEIERTLLKPRGLDYRVQFPGPTGTNAVEAALKLARKVTGREGVIAFTNGFHGMSLGALSVTGNAFKRAGAGVPLGHTNFMPFADYLGDEADTLTYLETFIKDSSSGVDLPAAIILETVQAEGGVNVASFAWLQRLRKLTREHGILLIIDDIQVGCGRTGPFLSFEPADIEPDILCLSKSMSGFGLPFAITLFRPELDVWSPGEHNGTFRGHNLAFVTATAALRTYWQDDALPRATARKHETARKRLEAIAARHPELGASVRGRGMILGLDVGDTGLAGRFSRAAFDRGLLIETAGPTDNVLKLLPPVTLTEAELNQGLDIIDEAVDAVMAENGPSPRVVA
ncbi:MAG: diaminobutyrate--2-oxoglutarate transaminase [Deltaproteobacteria bacterium]|nr:MAG: diaminobutyrate--2-oxoglutarate transaminase [Deltaproteobacteria bacterium]